MALPTWPKTAIMVFGACMFVFCLGALIWSLTRPPVTDGPMPPEPAPLTPKKG